jgi:hypothetical protein
MYESVDVDAPDAQIKWGMANAQYQELQQKRGIEPQRPGLTVQACDGCLPTDLKVGLAGGGRPGRHSLLSVKQALAASAGLIRAGFTTQMAVRVLRKLGFKLGEVAR